MPYHENTTITPMMKELYLALIDSVMQHDIETLTQLLESHADINLAFTTDKGDNLLHFCVVKHSSHTLRLTQLLLQAGVDPLGVNEKFLTPWELAQKHNNTLALSQMKSFISSQRKDLIDYINHGASLQ